eukprot:1002047-Pyramimonas_sp.AAC.1
MTTTATITRDFSRKNLTGKKTHRRHLVTWLTKVASNVVGYVWARRSLGGFAGSAFVSWSACAYFNAVEWT